MGQNEKLIVFIGTIPILLYILILLLVSDIDNKKIDQQDDKHIEQKAK